MSTRIDDVMDSDKNRDQILKEAFGYHKALVAYAYGLLRDYALAEDAVQKVEVPLTGIPASEIPEAPEWTVSQPDDIDGKAIQILIRFIELPDGSTDIGREMTFEESSAFMKKITEQKGVDILTAPSVLSKDGRSATIEVGRMLSLMREDNNEFDEI